MSERDEGLTGGAPGLDRLIVQALPLGEGTRMLWLTLAFVAVIIVLSTFMSNTAASNLLLPIGISPAVALGGAGETRHIGMSIALSAALAMALPVSTPPNAIAYSRNELTVRDMARAGVLVGLAGAALVVLLLPLLLRLPAQVLSSFAHA